MTVVSSDGAAVTTDEADGGIDQNQTVRLGSPFAGGIYTGAHSPYPIKPGPELIDAVDFTPAARSDNYATGFVQHQPKHEPNAIFIDGVNIRDIITALTARVHVLDGQ